MKKLILTILIILFTLTFNAGCSSDFDKGWDAYESGDYATALKWYTLAAEQGDADAQFNLGSMYRYGDGVSQDDKTAVKWYTLAAKQGHADAKRKLNEIKAEEKRIADAKEAEEKRIAAKKREENEDGHFFANIICKKAKKSAGPIPSEAVSLLSAIGIDPGVGSNTPSRIHY